MLTIGQMSKTCGVSVKTLHHYDKIGLLRPEKIDRNSGYRYYEEEQIPTMLLISRLKRYGFALSDIGYLLEHPECMGAELRRQQFRLTREAERLSTITRELVHHIDQLERTGDIMSYQNHYEIQTELAEEQWLLSQRQTMSVEDFGKYYGVLFEKIARERIPTSGITLTVYHDKEFDPASSDMELGVGVTERKNATTILPKRLCATTVHIGSYSGLPDAYGAVVSWLKGHGYEMNGAPYEVYLKNQFNGLPPKQWETKIFFPVQEK